MKDEEKIEEMTGVMNEAKSVADEAEKKYEEVMAGDAAVLIFFRPRHCFSFCCCRCYCV